MKRQKHHENEENEDTGSHDHNQRENKDTLTDLPDCVLIHILSFLNSKDAVRTCILSSRWKHLWKHLTALTLYSSHFRTVKGFMEFVYGILSLRDNSTPLNAIDFECQVRVESRELERIVRYAASHNVNCLRLSYKYGGFSPSFLLSSHSLTSLDIGFKSYSREKKFPNSLNLPALTYLKLHYFSEISTFKRLNTLILYYCIVEDAQQPLCISSTTLLNLSIYSGYVSRYSGCVCYGRAFSNIDLFAPSLCTFALTCTHFPKLFGIHLSSIEQVSIDVRLFMPLLALLNFLIELPNIKSLTITPTTLQTLWLVPDILKLKLTCLCNLKSLNLELDSNRFPVTRWRNIKLELADGKSWKENDKLRETIKAGLDARCSFILDRIIELLLQNSPSAKVDVLLRELN